MTLCLLMVGKHNFTLSILFVNKVLHIYKACYKTVKYMAKTCHYKLSPYLCNVFFIVLDLRLTKDWLSGIDSLFLCPNFTIDPTEK